MSTLSETVQTLQLLTHQLREIEKLNQSPALSVDLAEAAGRLRMTLPPNTFFGIHLNVVFPQENLAPVVEWQVYDQSKVNGNNFFNARTLADAVAACIANHTPLVPQTLADVEETLAPMPF